MFNVLARPVSAGNPGNSRNPGCASRFLSHFTQAVAVLLFLAPLSTPMLHAQASVKESNADVFKPPPPVTYTEKFEAYGGLSFLNGQAGQNLPKRYNMGGGEGSFTYYVRPKWGALVDFRWEGGTTPVLPLAQSYNVQTRPFVSQTIIMGGARYRWLGSQKAALNLHAMAGESNGNFSHSLPKSVPSQPQCPTTECARNAAGLYKDHAAFMGTAGASIDFNRSARWAIRLQPEIVFEHFGTETREFFSVSGGVVYRFGHR